MACDAGGGVAGGVIVSKIEPTSHVQAAGLVLDGFDDLPKKWDVHTGFAKDLWTHSTVLRGYANTAGRKWGSGTALSPNYFDPFSRQQ